MTPVLELSDVRFDYVAGPAWARRRVPALHGVSLVAGRGETVGLVGESGSGKSTIGKLCLGLLRPQQGAVMFDGRPLDRRALRGRFSVVLQHPQWSLDPRLTVGASVEEPLAIVGDGSRPERRERVAAMLAEVGLDPSFADRYPAELSGGQRQRASVARALVTEPRFVLFDEAVSALDVSIQAQILNLIRRLQEQHGFAALFISHDLAATRYAADRIVVMRGGEIVDEGTAAAFYEPSTHPYTRALQRASEI
ncbi:ATP-binding cassette domain-containing protein [Conexibacter stalactiti]|uniref:ATP-binding cassette domain-containing protein n=1 Tax=Conexibacter stalactiti TaxID=1940611 RepID=A0ABU4HIV5_9ACTN|nr:ATP-binding cassette domain-containing protein [Conexibacter stalactiti]MDW5593238.1 ATP-binding cassette domain-containing protein [Conexibacter stalactiti]MEC5033879.1 ATP-binding cassette domain-containing protein [Conexibacter stalactiti]